MLLKMFITEVLFNKVKIKLVWHEFILTVVPILFILNNNRNLYSAYLLGITGILYHGFAGLSFAIAKKFLILDKISVITVIMYINSYTKTQPITGGTSMITLIIWQCNNYYNCGLKNNMIHLLFIQLPGYYVYQYAIRMI